MNLKERISIYYTSLTTTEKRIYTQIMDNPHIIIDHSIIEAGNLCHTSKSAMLRFAKKLGYRGYSEFKYAIEESIKKDLEDAPRINNNETILHQISSSFALTIQAIGQLNYDDQLQSLASDIDQYPYIKSIGIGNSAFCANQLVYSLYSHNKFIEGVVDDVQFSYLNNCLNEDYLLIIFSVSASSTTYTKLMKTAKTKGSKIVLITMNNDSPINKLADIVFTLPSNIAPTSSSSVLKQLDNRTTLYFFAEIISYYYGIFLEKKTSL